MNNNKNYRIMKFFEVADKSCTGKGYVKIDMRGNRGAITVNVENLGDGKTTSEVYLFKNKEDKIKVGPINNKRGRLQRNILLNGKDESIENYNICGVVYNNKILMYTPVFIPLQVNQLSVLLDEEESQEKETTVETKNKIIQCEDELEDNIQDNFMQNKGSERMIYETDKQYNDQNIYQNEYDNSNTNEQAKQCSRNYRNEYERKLFALLNEFEMVNPLQYDINNLSWWKVVYDENSIYKGFLPYFNQIITTYYPYPLSNRVTTCQILMKKHGYYLFGIYEENGNISKYVYGVPGKFTRDEQPYRGVTGFKNWSYKNNDIPGDYGYWIAFIDANTGAVTEPPEVE